jgi:hypothetical protein
MDAESIGQLSQRGHVRLGLVLLGTHNDGAVKTGTFGQLRLSKRVQRPEPPQVLPHMNQCAGHGNNLRSLVPLSAAIVAQ